MKSKFTISNCFTDKKLIISEVILEKIILIILHGLTNFHKPIVDQCESLRPILAAVKIPLYEISKFLNLLLALFEPISYTFKYLLSFANDFHFQVTFLVQNTTGPILALSLLLVIYNWKKQ